MSAGDAPQPLQALVLGDGEAPTRAGLDAAWPGWDAGVSLVVAADGGARLGPALGLTIDRWVGDGDSLPAAAIAGLAAGGTDVRLVAATKDESDLELALVAATDAGAGRITILGALRGPRLDHELANVLLLAHPAAVERGAQLILLAPGARVRLLAAPDAATQPVELDLAGRVGDLVSLLPIGGDVAGVVTRGLRYPLAGEPLVVGPARGLSNVRISPEAGVSIRSGRLLVIETPANLDR